MPGVTTGIGAQVLADASHGGLLAKGDFSKLAAEAYGVRFDDIGMETGTFDADVTTGQNGDVAARIWSNVNDGEGRWTIGQPDKRVPSTDVVIRMKCALGTVAAGGSDTVKYRLDFGFHDDGEQYPTSMASSVTVTKDLTGIAVRTYFNIDFTIPQASWGTKAIVELHLIRLANADAADQYTAGSFYQHRLDIGCTAYGGASLPAAPT